MSIATSVTLVRRAVSRERVGLLGKTLARKKAPSLLVIQRGRSKAEMDVKRRAVRGWRAQGASR